MTAYIVRQAINTNPSILRHWGEDVEIALSCCYQDRFEVGEFETDQEAIEAVQKMQERADDLAGDVAAEYGLTFDFSKLPRYADHLYKKRTYSNGRGTTTYQKVTGKAWGGRRSKAGTKPMPGGDVKFRAIQLNDEDHAMFLELGGVRWLRSVLRKEIQKRKNKETET